ncbi:hypothetical protein [Sutcliffiella horikoshii]|uniref:hypothetical protein n=1 Tax=Sutcliffiella horikoshii TaxID=79883 RepID=UPI001CFF2807|nr:hypothetical protein [Sutcliffiella horikoshii]
MKKSMLLGLISSVLFLGGCGMNTEIDGNGSDKNGGSDTLALSDDFTKSFLNNDTETEDGYYLYESATKGYTMLFPVNGKIEGESYERNKNGFESVSFLEKEEENISSFYKVIYESRERTNNIELNKELLSSYVSYDGEYEEYSKNDKSYYYGESIYDFDDGNKSYQYFAYIKANNESKGASFIASISCSDKEKACEANSEVVKKKVTKILDSINFESR